MHERELILLLKTKIEQSDSQIETRLKYGNAVLEMYLKMTKLIIC